MRLLADPDSRVIALSGKWGTGKSHLWHEVQAASSDEAVKGALYVSLFGLSDTDQLKKKLLGFSGAGGRVKIRVYGRAPSRR